MKSAVSTVTIMILTVAVGLTSALKFFSLVVVTTLKIEKTFPLERKMYVFGDESGAAEGDAFNDRLN